MLFLMFNILVEVFSFLLHLTKYLFQIVSFNSTPYSLLITYYLSLYAWHNIIWCVGWWKVWGLLSLKDYRCYFFSLILKDVHLFGHDQWHFHDSTLSDLHIYWIFLVDAHCCACMAYLACFLCVLFALHLSAR